jgi:hypothetical protein
MDRCDPQKADHCTRCREPFDPAAARFMVSAHVVLEVIDRVAITRGETVPVCSACATPKEQARATREATCVVCGCRMLKRDRSKAICSNRCQQRERRARRRALRQQRCTVCHHYFSPKRDDAMFCSSACRQRAYRLRKLGGLADR